MTTSKSRTHKVCVGDVVNLLGNSQYRVLKIVTPTGPILLKRTDQSTYRSFSRTPAHFQIRAPTMVTQSPQTEPPISSDADVLARDILNCSGPVAVDAYQQGRPYCPVLGLFICHLLLSLREANLKRESIITNRKQQNNILWKQHLQNVTELEHF